VIKKNSNHKIQISNLRYGRSSKWVEERGAKAASAQITSVADIHVPLSDAKAIAELTKLIDALERTTT
jgi:hypothetical protein